MIPISLFFVASALILGPLRDTLLPLPEGVSVQSVVPLSTPPIRVDTLESFGKVHARVVDTLPEWGFRLEEHGGRRFLHIHSVEPLTIRVEWVPRSTSPRPASLRDTLDLLIVTPRRFRSAAEVYRELRERDGVRTGIVDLEDVLATGDAPARALQSYLQTRSAQQPVRHVFLVGPVPEVPVVFTRVDGIYQPLPFYERVPTDAFFSYAYDDSWNADGDTLVGEVQDGVDPRFLIRRFNVGRLVVQTPEELLRYAAKVDRYLHTPRSAVQYVFHGPKISPSLYGSTYLSGARTYLPDGVKPVELFEENGIIAEDTFFARLQEASLFVGVAHGYNDLYQINYSPWIDARIPRFFMDTTYPPFVFYPIACELLAFDEGALGVWGLLGEGGPVAVYGMVRLDFPDYSQYLALWFMQALHNGARTLGEADAFVRENLRMYTGLYNSVPRYLFFGYTLLGDPSLPVFTQPLEPLDPADLSLVIQPVSGGWHVTGGHPESRLVVENSMRQIFSPPYDVLIPSSFPPPRLRLILHGTIPAETVLAARPYEHAYLDIRASEQATQGETLLIQVKAHSPVGGTLQVNLPDTILRQVVIGPESLTLVWEPPVTGFVKIHARLDTPEGDLEAQHTVRIHPLFPTLLGVLVDTPAVRVVLKHAPGAWRGGQLVAEKDTLLLPDSGSAPLWFSPPVVSGETLALTFTIHGFIRETTVVLSDTLTRTGGLMARSVPGGAELYASDSLCDAYAFPGLSLWLDRNDLPFRTDGEGDFVEYCVRKGVGAPAGTLRTRRGPPVRLPYPLLRPEFLVTQTGPLPGRFLDPGRSEVALMGQDGRIHLLDALTGEVLLFVPPEAPISEVFRDAVRADLDGNGLDDLVFVQRDPAGFRGLLNGSGFFVPTPVSVVRTPIAWDLDGDGRDEVYTSYGRALLRLKSLSGSVMVDTLAFLASGAWTSRVALAPSRTTLLAGANLGGTYALLRISATGTLDTLATLPAPVQDLAVGDVHPDTGLEIVTVSSDSVRILRDTAHLFSFAVPLRSSDPALVDVDGDGFLDVVLKVKDSTGTRYQVAAYRYDGTELFRSPESWENGLSFPTPLAGCGSRVIYGNRGDNLYLWGGNPSSLFLGHKLGGGVFIGTNGALWIASFLGPLWVLETGLICSPTDWRTAYHDLHRTAHAGVSDLLVRREESNRPGVSLRLPRVLRASQTPLLVLPGLRVYDRAGRLLGVDRVRIRGLPSGVYILQTPSSRQKVLILP